MPTAQLGFQRILRVRIATRLPIRANGKNVGQSVRPTTICIKDFKISLMIHRSGKIPLQIRCTPEPTGLRLDFFLVPRIKGQTSETAYYLSRDIERAFGVRATSGPFLPDLVSRVPVCHICEPSYLASDCESLLSIVRSKQESVMVVGACAIGLGTDAI
jgi:hypothetical protein